MDIFSMIGNVCSIGGLLLSFWLLVRTGKIEKNVNSALEQNKKEISWIKYRKEIEEGINDCAKYLINEHTIEEQKPYIQKLDRCFVDILTYYPKLTPEMKSDIKAVRNYCAGIGTKQFSYITVFNRVNNVLSNLKKEDSFYDSHWE